jgi:hypothetical protein
MVVSHLDEAMAEIRKQAMDRLTKAGYYLADKMSVALSVPYPPASLPGERPRRRTGDLQGAVQVARYDEELRVRVGIEDRVYYGVFLDRGTRNMEARPFLSYIVATYAPNLAGVMVV